MSRFIILILVLLRNIYTAGFAISDAPAGAKFSIGFSYLLLFKSLISKFYSIIMKVKVNFIANIGYV